MNISIKDTIISKLKSDNEDSIISIIDSSVLMDDEIVLPGLGVLIGLFWNELSHDEKYNISSIIKRKISG